jgi:hypothetical protein
MLGLKELREKDKQDFIFICRRPILFGFRIVADSLYKLFTKSRLYFRS